MSGMNMTERLLLVNMRNTNPGSTAQTNRVLAEGLRKGADAANRMLLPGDGAE